MKTEAQIIRDALILGNSIISPPEEHIWLFCFDVPYSGKAIDLTGAIAQLSSRGPSIPWLAVNDYYSGVAEQSTSESVPLQKPRLLDFGGSHLSYGKAIDLQSERYVVDSRLYHWGPLGRSSQLPYFDVQEVDTGNILAEENYSQEDFSAHAVLAAIESDDTDSAELAQWIIDAEALHFSESQLMRLRPRLKRFVLDHRESDKRTEQIAVGSAIRKYVATMLPDELPQAAFLLDAGGRSSPPIRVELEVAKMVVRKLTAVPSDHPDCAPELGERLFEIAKTYLNDRLLTREKFGATATYAVLGLALLQSARFQNCVELFASLRSQWFVDHLAAQAGEIMQSLAEAANGNWIAPVTSNLNRLVMQTSRR